MRSGRIKWFNAAQNYGYITLFDGVEVYFHATCLRANGSVDALNPGADVTFDLIQTRTGFEAQNVEVIV